MSDMYRHSDGSLRDYPEAVFSHTFNDEDCELLENGDILVATDKEKGTKNDSNKAPIHMIPEDAILGMAEAFAYGAKKYDRFNYRKGLEITRLTDSLMRHTLAFLKGEDIDPESGLHHTKHILANAAMIEYTRIYRPECDDRYKEGKNE
jgi:hypothetical protein